MDSNCETMVICLGKMFVFILFGVGRACIVACVSACVKCVFVSEYVYISVSLTDIYIRYLLSPISSDLLFNRMNQSSFAICFVFLVTDKGILL